MCSPPGTEQKHLQDGSAMRLARNLAMGVFYVIRDQR